MPIIDRLLKLLVIAFIGFVYLPAVLVVILSFNQSSAIAFPMTGLTLDWYIKKPVGHEYESFVSLLYTRPFWEALRNSVANSSVVAVLTALIVTSSALALRHKVRGRDQMFYLILLGFIVPGVALGLGSTILYSVFHLQVSFWSVVLINAVYTVPFGLILMMSRFDPDLVEYERAASTLRAAPAMVFRRITAPLIQWEIISAAIFGFLLSWGELIRTQFMLKGIPVLSVYIFTQLSVNPLTPKWYAAGTLISAVSVVGLVVLGFLLSRGQR
jgi:ABC-type spermidine/putrescine transport system permease subunit II